MPPRADLPPLTWLRAFEAAARTLSFTQAATELNLTQAAISKHVKSLELHLRQPLFHRRPRSLELTHGAEAYLPKVQDALDRLASGTREVFGARQTGTLTLRCAVSFATNWLAPRLPDWLDHAPSRRIRILSSVWNDSFDRNAFDMDIQYGRGTWPDLISHRLTWETITPLCAPGVALANPDDLRDHRLLHVLGYQEGWAIWLNAARARRVDPGQGLHLDTSLAAFALAAAGGGIALGRRSLAGPDHQAGRLIAPFALEVAVEEAFHLLQPRGGSAHPDAADFTEWLLAQARRDAPEA